uniref:Uncharacterized protein n=1 Tax=Avena sativa TaxID=4498 RepID=A0ACD6A731_AVESA
MYSLRQLAGTGSTRLGRFGGRRSVSATSNAAAPVAGDQGVRMDPARQQPHAPEGRQQDRNRDDDTHTTHGDVMTDSFGAGYSTRSDEEGFGGVYGQNDPEYRAAMGSKEKRRHLDADKHAT